mgnify:CR=1 FL=1
MEHLGTHRHGDGFLGLTIETVSRTLTQLRSKGVISPMGSGHILLSKPDDLDDLAEGF